MVPSSRRRQPPHCISLRHSWEVLSKKNFLIRSDSRDPYVCRGHRDPTTVASRSSVLLPNGAVSNAPPKNLPKNLGLVSIGLILFAWPRMHLAHHYDVVNQPLSEL